MSKSFKEKTAERLRAYNRMQLDGKDLDYYGKEFRGYEEKEANKITTQHIINDILDEVEKKLLKEGLLHKDGIVKWNRIQQIIKELKNG